MPPDISPASDAPSLSTLGWTPSMSPPTRELVELVRAPAWTVARLWTTPTVLDSRALRSGSVRVILGVDGDAALRFGPTKSLLKAQHLIVLEGETPITTENRDFWARCEWHLRAPLFREKRFSRYLGTPIRPSPGFHHLLATTTNVIATNQGFSRSAGSTLMLEALADLVLAAVADDTDAPTVLTTAQKSLFENAVREIDERYRDASLTVSRIAERMAVSTAYLHRVFTRAGTTPREEIESRRVAAASILLDAAPAQDRHVLESIAFQTGFSSPRRMQVAIHRRRTVRPSPTINVE
ncbi:AraC-like DNA-binding protein [Microbacterium resistens]|uniref:AraC-like DNA-binding protein n=1 Tax=Microbacterium resistens TaxID=156977 RepID=A0ABU1SEU8_9MICO|nr:helix-turn-helix domain-containing protein [Microbacterium resistens]MDR6868131.1 AraC-like DNA-binding protein [Microbacterium resistens]